jgi:hypothetical protein
MLSNSSFLWNLYDNLTLINTLKAFKIIERADYKYGVKTLDPLNPLYYPAIIHAENLFNISTFSIPIV